ncbi:uncharacterized protein LOC109706952 [Ananas comosus]|uniref:Uncharacterized protein LOC109706952 n=2 Tax=Ananas comosus TaxID=4615 RepID=A0A6P5EQK8_ANACO|nr:uncharacterized protein LOC109706952 [Ananas comosus]CAD1826616.1 unnamed protein product [Ananas comosus var. bracteatus]
MASSPTSLSLSLDSTLHPILSRHHNPRHSHRPFSLSKPYAFARSLLRRRRSSLPAPPVAADSSLGGGGGGGCFLDLDAPERLRVLEEFRYEHEFEHGSLLIRAMNESELDAAVELLAESFSESMWAPPRYTQLLAFLVKQYVVERRRLVPHAVVLVGLYTSKKGAEEAELACTAEVSFDAVGAIAAPPTPPPPPDCPYICNMTVKKSLRRRGIGKQLLKACEELIIRMGAKRTVYLHCRMVDKVPFKMYKKAGYEVVRTDSILVWLSVQRRKYLMRKQLPESPCDSQCNATYFSDQSVA